MHIKLAKLSLQSSRLLAHLWDATPKMPERKKYPALGQVLTFVYLDSLGLPLGFRQRYF